VKPNARARRSTTAAPAASASRRSAPAFRSTRFSPRRQGHQATSSTMQRRLRIDPGYDAPAMAEADPPVPILTAMVKVAR
jgi:hypothetical protein